MSDHLISAAAHPQGPREASQSRHSDFAGEIAALLDGRARQAPVLSLLMSVPGIVLPSVHSAQWTLACTCIDFFSS